jgi:hypothetical protein
MQQRRVAAHQTALPVRAAMGDAGHETIQHRACRGRSIAHHHAG